jgi:soluble lytic murein transglycosylase-like protein
MELNEVLIRTEHPPHPGTYKKNRLLLLCIFRKVALFILIFILFFHFSNFSSRFGLDQREQAIQEILEVLDRQPTGLARVTKEELAEVIYEEAHRYQHDPKFILALIAIESSFQNWSISERGARGLMQIMPYVAESLTRELGIEWRGDRTLFNPYLNIKIGSYYLFQLIKEFNDLSLALAAYNYGPTYVKNLRERKERIPTHFFYKIRKIYQKL